MILTKTVQMDRECIRELFEAMIVFSISIKGRPTKEQCYAAYILQQLYMKLRSRENRMYDTGKDNVKMKLNSVQALLLADVIQNYQATIRLNVLLMELGKILPRITATS